MDLKKMLEDFNFNVDQIETDLTSIEYESIDIKDKSNDLSWEIDTLSSSVEDIISDQETLNDHIYGLKDRLNTLKDTLKEEVIDHVVASVYNKVIDRLHHSMINIIKDIIDEDMDLKIIDDPSIEE